MNIDKRKFVRHDISLSVDFKEAKEGSLVFSGSTINFSRSGLCLKIEDALPDLKGPVDLKVALPDKKDIVPALGDVVWIEQEGNHCLLGIKLVAMDKEAKFHILDYCHNLQMNTVRDEISLN
jgi:c-di-GMP-binding flagellar brake protein YcgR